MELIEALEVIAREWPLSPPNRRALDCPHDTRKSCGQDTISIVAWSEEVESIVKDRDSEIGLDHSIKTCVPTPDGY